MKTLQEIKARFYSVLGELQHRNGEKSNDCIKHMLVIQLELLMDILGDEIDEDFTEQAEVAISKAYSEI